MDVKHIDVQYLNAKFSGLDVFIFPITVRDLLSIHYVAARGRSSEEGAVQRILNKRRIQSIKEFILKGNMFFNTFILNWTDSEFEPKIRKETIRLPLQGRRAQVIDGQHRLMGLQAALNENDEIGDKEVLVTLSLHLSTKEAATIFLNINSEQKPVPKSLIYDLFGEAVDDREHAINRSKDIADFLNAEKMSPFWGRIKYPGGPRGQGTLDLSIIVNALKKHLEADGVFHRYNLDQIEVQQKVIVNFFMALKRYYDQSGLWENKSKNPFLKASGFNGALEYLVEDLLVKCQLEKSFKVETFRKLLNLNEDGLIINSDIKGLDGKTARKEIKKFFIESQKSKIPESEEYEF
ncbi:DGQHR domain-containing protein [bacterium]|nr:DGQHR domain-containing protein [bacterium]